MSGPTGRTLPRLGAILAPVATPPAGIQEAAPAAPTPRSAPPVASPAMGPATKPAVVNPHADAAPPAWDVTDGNVYPEATDHVYLVPRQVYLPRSVHMRAKSYAAESGMSVTEMIVTALSDMYTAVPAYVQREKAQESPVGLDLYAIPQRARRTRQPDRQVQTSIRITDEQLAAMDRLALQYGLNRSRLLGVCLQLWLAQKVGQAT